MHAGAWLIVKDCLKLERVADSLRRQYEAREDDLLGGCYSQTNDIGVRQTASVEDIAIDLAELSQMYEKKIRDINNHIDTYQKALNTLDEIELFKFNKAINNQDLMLHDMELAKVMIKVGKFVSEHHNIKHSMEDRTTKERFIKRIAFQTKYEIRQNELRGVL